MKKIFSVCAVAVMLTIALSACALPPPPASEVEKNETGTALIACLHRAAHSHDDGKSPADSVALGILPICAREYEQDKQTFERGMNFQTQQLFEQKTTLHHDYLTLATTAVLDERRH